MTEKCMNCEELPAGYRCDCGCDGDYCVRCWMDGVVSMPSRKRVTSIRVQDNSKQPKAFSYLDAEIEIEHGAVLTTRQITIYEHEIPSEDLVAWKVACAAWPDLEALVLNASNPTT